MRSSGGRALENQDAASDAWVTEVQRHRRLPKPRPPSASAAAPRGTVPAARSTPREGPALPARCAAMGTCVWNRKVSLEQVQRMCE